VAYRRRYVITDRVVNGARVWAAEDGEWFVYRDGNGRMEISNKAGCAAGTTAGEIWSSPPNQDCLAPTQLHNWWSGKRATLEQQYKSGASRWVQVPGMRVTAVHGLDDAEPTMAAALRQLAALTGAE